MKDTFICAARELNRRRGRTLANMYGYALATALVVVLVTLILASRSAEQGILAGTGAHFVGYAPICLPEGDPGSMGKSYEGFALGGFDPKYALAVASTCCAETNVIEGKFLTPDDQAGDRPFWSAGMLPGRSVRGGGRSASSRA